MSKKYSRREMRINIDKKNPSASSHLHKESSREEKDYLCKDLHCVIEYIIPYSEYEDSLEE